MVQPCLGVTWCYILLVEVERYVLFGSFWIFLVEVKSRRLISSCFALVFWKGYWCSERNWPWKKKLVNERLCFPFGGELLKYQRRTSLLGWHPRYPRVWRWLSWWSSCRIKKSKGIMPFHTTNYNWVVVSNIFYVHPYLGKIPILTNIFHRGWNHQLDKQGFR